MSVLRIKSEYPVYPHGGCIPYTIYWVELRKEGMFFNSWVRIKGFDDKTRAEEFAKTIGKLQ